MSQQNIYPLKKYILRTPAYSISTYLNLLNDYSVERLYDYIYKDDYFLESIRIASPDFYDEVKKCANRFDLFSNKDREKLRLSILKYFSRISSRATPFGLFAGCSVGSISNDQTSIILKTKQYYKRYTQLDMKYWVSLIENIVSRKDIRPYLNYYPNTSIYSVLDYYRYTEYEYNNGQRDYKISAIRKTTYLEKLYENSKNGISFSEMIDIIVDSESEKDEATDYVNQLIDSQFFVSNLSPVITGNNEWNRVFEILKSIPLISKELEILRSIKYQTSKLDSKVTPEEEIYQSLYEQLSKLNISFEKDKVLQTDLNKTLFTNNLNHSLKDKIIEATKFLFSINQNLKSNNLTEFRKAFTKRYDSKQMPINIVLDGDIGIGYPANLSSNDTNSLLEKFSFTQNGSILINENWADYEYILEKKLQESILKNSYKINLCENDFINVDLNINDVPVTYSVLIELIKNDNEEQIVLDAISGISATKLLGRFCSINDSIFDLTKEILEKESKSNKGKILAEIVHIPESRTGNILRRPTLREYEIPYLCNSAVKKEFQIEVSDLLISVKEDKIILISKKLNKEVIPCLSNAHNYSKNNLPLYHFLCDIQSQNSKPISSFSWGILESHYTFFPRVYYKDIILSKARWIINKKEITTLYKLDEIDLKKAFTLWKKEKNIPRYVNWVQYDNTLLLDLERQIGINLFLNSVKGNDRIVLEEFLFTGDTIVKNIEGEDFTNQIIISFYNEKIFKND